MSLKIRLQRFGNKNRPFFHIVVADTRNARNGRFLEKIGYYNPMTEPSVIEFDGSRAQHWYSFGARPSDCVKALFRAKKFDLT